MLALGSVGSVGCAQEETNSLGDSTESVPIPCDARFEGPERSPLAGQASIATHLEFGVSSPMPGYLDDQLRQSILSGETLVLFEVLSDELPSSESRDCQEGALALYQGRDADEPAFPANNFVVPPEHDACCAFKVESASLEDGGLRPKVQWPLHIQGRELRSIESLDFDLPLTFFWRADDVEDAVRLEGATLEGTLDAETGGLASARIEADLVADSIDHTDIQALFRTALGVADRCDARGCFGWSVVLEVAALPATIVGIEAP